MLRSPSVTLISMPWTTLVEPCLGLGMLRTVLDEAGIAAKVRHLNLEMLRWLTPLTYTGIASVFALNDFLFTGALDPGISPRQERWLREKTYELLSHDVDERAHGGVDGVMQKLLDLRTDTIPRWLDEVAEEIASSDATLVGFTCMFDQTIASVALAHKIRERAPDKLLALGGYAVRPPTGEAVMRAFPWIDAVCVADGEPVIVPLARASGGLLPLTSIPGTLVRKEGAIHLTSPAAQIDMDAAPIPNYEDFFTDVASLFERHQVAIEVNRLPVESSRGCWWGAVHHCTFCGIHDDDMAFRTRSAGRVLETLDTLSARHHVRSFRFSDYILPHSFGKTLIPELIRRGAPYQITCEVKANFTTERFAQLATAGFIAVQPGVESFATPVLRRMDKGVTAAQNVHTLLLGRRYRVRIDYNLLYGFPGDEENDYEDMLRQLPRLLHLDPPSSRLEVQITRYAPLQTNPERFGLSATPHMRSYELVFSRDYLALTRFDLDAYCYYFERPFENPPRLERLFRQIDRIVDLWRAEHDRRLPALWYRPFDGGIEIEDSRALPAQRYFLATETARVLLTASEPIQVERLAAISPAFMDRLAELEAHGLVFRDGNKVVSLALPHPDLADLPFATTCHSAEPTAQATAPRQPRVVHLPLAGG